MVNIKETSVMGMLSKMTNNLEPGKLYIIAKYGKILLHSDFKPITYVSIDRELWSYDGSDIHKCGTLEYNEPFLILEKIGTVDYPFYRIMQTTESRGCEIGNLEIEANTDWAFTNVDFVCELWVYEP